MGDTLHTQQWFIRHSMLVGPQYSTCQSLSFVFLVVEAQRPEEVVIYLYEGLWITLKTHPTGDKKKNNANI